MQLNWRAISGPALTTATAVLAFLVDRQLFPIPNPAPLFVCIVALVASASGIVSGMASAAIAVASFRAVLSQPPRRARLRHVGPGAHAAAGGDRGRHRAHHRPPPAEVGRRICVAEEASCHRRPPVGRARSGRHRHRAARCRYPGRIHQPRLPRLFRAIRRAGRQQAALHRADVSRPRHRRLANARARAERLHRQAHRNDPDRRIPRRSTSTSPMDRCCASFAPRCPMADAC